MPYPISNDNAGESTVGASKGHPTEAKIASARAGTRERDLVIGLIALVVALTSLPRLFGYLVAPGGGLFIGAAYNIDDSLVYLSWLHQTAQGHFFLRNLFTTDYQPTLLFNFLISAMGMVERATHLSAIPVAELTRVIGAVALLWTIYCFYRTCIPSDRAARLTAFGLVCLSSGFGWTTWRQWQDHNAGGFPIDAWQPEAYTFASIDLSFLFAVGTFFIVAALYALLLSARTGRLRYAIIAGICGFVIGNIHTYDILHVAAAWGLFLVCWTLIRRRRGLRRLWVHSIAALAISLPTTLYVYHAMRTNPVFSARAATATLSPPFHAYVAGYGFVFIFAVIAAVILLVRRRQMLVLPATVGDSPVDPEVATEYGWADRASLLFVCCWAVAGLAIIRIHEPFQRKMIMGEHIPLCLLAGWAAAYLTRRFKRPVRIACLCLLVAATFPSNAFSIRRDLIHVSQNRSETAQWPILTPTYMSAIDYIDKRTPPNAPIIAMPVLAAYIPGLTGHPVWAGHWGETPDFAWKSAQFGHFADPNTSDDDRIAFLQTTQAQYLLYLNTATIQVGPRVIQYADFAHNPPAYLKQVYRNKDFTIFKIVIQNS